MARVIYKIVNGRGAIMSEDTTQGAIRCVCSVGKRGIEGSTSRRAGEPAREVGEAQRNAQAVGGLLQ